MRSRASRRAGPLVNLGTDCMDAYEPTADGQCGCWTRTAAACGGRNRDQPPTKTALIERLDPASCEGWPSVSQRMDFISGQLLGIRYQAETLIGGPKCPESSLSATMLSIASPSAKWCWWRRSPRSRGVRDVAPPHPRRPRQRAVRRPQSLFRRLVQAQHRERILPAARHRAVDDDRQDVTGHREFGRRQVPFVAISKETLLANAKLLAPGDIIGFVSRRAEPRSLSHGSGGIRPERGALLRNASQSRSRVVEDKMAVFVTANR